MYEDRIQTSVDQTVLGMRIVLFALTMGVLVFGAIAILTASEPKDGPFMAWIGLGMGVGPVILRQILRVVIPAGLRRGIVSTDSDSEQCRSRLLSGYQSVFVISAALLEGGCFFNLVCYMVEKQWPSLAYVGVCLVINLSTFPSKDGVETWIQQQLELIDLERNQVN